MASSKIQKILAIATTVCVILTGICFIVCCAHLYFTGGDEPYSRERVGEYLIVTAAPSVASILLAIGGLIYSAIIGKTDDDRTPRTNLELLESFAKRYDVNLFEGEEKKEILQLRKNRKLLECVAHSFSAVVFLLVLISLFFCMEFSTESINADIITALAFVLPISALALGIHVIRLYDAEISAARELYLMKEYIKKNKVVRSSDVAINKNKIDVAVILRWVLLVGSIVLIVLGTFNGGMSDVFGKAVKICTECIGLG